MPVPLTFPVEKRSVPTYLNPEFRMLITFLHTFVTLCNQNAIKGPRNPSTVTLFQLFDHVIEGTPSIRSVLKSYSFPLHFISLMFALCPWPKLFMPVTTEAQFPPLGRAATATRDDNGGQKTSY